MFNYVIFSLILITIVLLVIKLFRKRNDRTPNIPEPPQDSLSNYPD
jgi:hypothetical protein